MRLCQWNYNYTWMYPLAANAKTDLVDGNVLKVQLYTAMNESIALGQEVEACIQGLGGLRCSTIVVRTAY